MSVITQKIKVFMFCRYSFFLLMLIFLLCVSVSYTFFESRIMGTRFETQWVTSPSGAYQAKVLLREFTLVTLLDKFRLRTFVQLKVRAKRDAEDWFEIIDTKLFTFSYFEEVFQHVELKWKSKDILMVTYYKKLSFVVPYDITHFSYCEVAVKY
mgnify:CR=1 FL=1